MSSNGFPDGKYAPNRAGVVGGITSLEPKMGVAMFSVVPGVDSSAADGMVIADFTNAATSDDIFIYLYFIGNDEISLSVCCSAGCYWSTLSEAGDWDCSSTPLLAGTKYDIRVEYDKYYIKIFVDNVERLTIPQDIVWSANSMPNEYHLGTDWEGGHAYTNATFDAPTMNIYDYKDGWKVIR